MSGPNEVGRGSEGSEAFRGLGPSVYIQTLMLFQKILLRTKGIRVLTGPLNVLDRILVATLSDHDQHIHC